MGTLVWGMLFGLLGMGYLAYARRQREVVPLLSGVGLIVSPYLISNIYGLMALGVLFSVLPFYLEL